MDRQRVLFLSAPFSGIEVFFRNLKPGIEKSTSIESDWVFIDWATAERSSKLPYVGSNWTIRCGLAARNAVLELERRGKAFDAVMFNHVTLPSLLRGFRRRTPTFLSVDVTPTLLDGFSSWYKGRVRGLSPALRSLKTMVFDQAVYHEATRILSWSELSRKSLVEEYGVPHNRIMVLPPGIDLRVWSLGEGQRISREKKDRLRILFVGADFERKGGDLLLAIAQMPEFRECDFDVVTKEAVSAASKNVRFHTGLAANSQRIRELYGDADIFFLPTRADFTPNAICEAMAMDLPVVSTRVGAIPEMVKEGETGILGPVDDREALSAALLKLIHDFELRIQMGRASRERASAIYDIAKTTEVVAKLLCSTQ